MLSRSRLFAIGRADYTEPELHFENERKIVGPGTPIFMIICTVAEAGFLCGSFASPTSLGGGAMIGGCCLARRRFGGWPTKSRLRAGGFAAPPPSSMVSVSAAIPVTAPCLLRIGAPLEPPAY